ncbi:hypothetical protein H4219_005951 [Mycoemilia scoparia]|uniref:S-adenosyl-L-methionine-dependent methyltransferase n=1 Tax=Mycoemilia scoparia TaxID=417184 RepID=A0A9W8DN63_9FUNG|nr:hypothetical protein H4219_005951 [Mycoemilia scoparia]
MESEQTSPADLAEYSKRWDEIWRTSENLPPWDTGKVCPALAQLIEEVKWPLPNKPNSQALVPGCGTGYEVLYLAEKGSPSLTVTGIDMSPNAIKEATKYRDSIVSSKNTIMESATRTNYEVADFFDFKIPENRYDLAFDMRFFCALPPSTRSKIGQRYGEIMNKGATLVTLMFPIKPREGGPPFNVSLKDYMDAFGPYFDLVYYNTKCKTVEKWADDEYIGVWQRR